jgi:hypothetical protein
MLLHAAFHGCETWSPTLSAETRLKASKTRVLRSEDGQSDRKLEKIYMMGSFIICTHHQILLR